MSRAASQTVFAGLISIVWPEPQAGDEGIKLPSNILWLCHIVRFAIIVYLGWRLWNFLQGIVLDQGELVHAIQKYDGIDVTGISNVQIYALWFLNFIVFWLLNALGILALFRIFAGFIQGRVFSVETGRLMRLAGIYTLLAVIAIPVRSTLAVALITLHLPEGAKWVMPYFDTGQVYDFVLGGTALVLGQVFKSAAEIARENSEIV